MNRHRIARHAAWGLIVVGILICVGWQFRIGVLKGQSFGTFIAPNTALLFVLVGASCLLQLHAGRGRRWAGLGVAIFIAIAGALITAEHLFHADLGVDRVFFAHRLTDWTIASPPGRVAFPTALAFVFTGTGLATLRLRNAASDWCATVVAGVAYLGLIGYGFSLAKLYGGFMAIPTALLLGVVALVVFTARAERGVADIVASRKAGGVVFRRVVPAIVILMPLFGYIRIRAQQNFGIGVEMGTALLVVDAVFVFTAIIAHTAGALNILDEKRKHAEQGLIRGEKLAAAGRLSATIAHEINNPLAAVMNLLYLAGTGASDQTTADYIRAAEKQLLRASEIAKRTLGFYREDAQPAHVSLSALAEEVLDVFRGNLMKRHVEITTDFQSPAIVEARPGEIRQIMANLVGNALDAVQASEHPHIALALRERQGVAEFVVRDNGCGIPSEHLQKIFEPFFTTKKDVGNGLGLYVSNQLAEKNGGGLHVESSTQLGASGATFVLTLPTARASGATSGERHAVRVETDVTKRRIRTAP